MYAVVRVYKGATALFDELSRREQDVRRVLSDVPGFQAYYLVRSADGGGASITICQDQAGTSESSRRAAEWVRQNVPQSASSPPEITEGEILYNF